MLSDVRRVGRIQTVDRAAAVLRLLAESRRQLALAELARELRLPKGTVFGIVQTLRTQGLVEQDSDSRRYRPGPALLVMGSAYRAHNESLVRSKHAAEMLAVRLEQTVRVGTLYDGRVLVLHHIPRGNEIGHRSDVGGLLPLDSTALGKVLVSEHPNPAPGYLTQDPVTAREHDQLIVEVDDVQVRGWTWMPRDPAPWLDSIAAPIRDHRGEIAAAIAISGPTHCLIDPAHGAPHQILVSRLVSAARAVSRGEAGGR